MGCISIPYFPLQPFSIIFMGCVINLSRWCFCIFCAHATKRIQNEKNDWAIHFILKFKQNTGRKWMFWGWMRFLLSYWDFAFIIWYILLIDRTLTGGWVEKLKSSASLSNLNFLYCVQKPKREKGLNFIFTKFLCQEVLKILNMIFGTICMGYDEDIDRLSSFWGRDAHTVNYTDGESFSITHPHYSALLCISVILFLLPSFM